MRGNNTSALYIQLVDNLKVRRFNYKMKKMKMLISLAKINSFIECINDLVIDFKSNRGNYVCLVCQNNFIKVVYDDLKNDFNYFNKIYWIRKENLAKYIHL